MKKYFIFALLLLFVLVVAAGCGSDVGTEASTDGDGLNFVLVSPLVGHPYWVAVEDGMIAANEELGVQTQYVGPVELNLNEQINFIETAIASQVDGIITMALDPEAFTPIIDRAVAAGIPVVLIDSDAPESERNFYAGTSNFQAGYEAGRAMAMSTGGVANIGVITGAIHAPNLIERIDGFRAAIEDYPDMVILAVEPADSDLLLGTQRAQTLLLTFPEIDAFFGVTAEAAQAAAIVAEEQDLVGNVTIVGFDDMEETLEFIRAGVIYATVVQRPFMMGFLGVELLYQFHAGTAPQDPIVDTGVTVVTLENVNDH